MTASPAATGVLCPVRLPAGELSYISHARSHHHGDANVLTYSEPAESASGEPRSLLMVLRKKFIDRQRPVGKSDIRFDKKMPVRAHRWHEIEFELSAACAERRGHCARQVRAEETIVFRIEPK